MFSNARGNWGGSTQTRKKRGPRNKGSHLKYPRGGAENEQKLQLGKTNYPRGLLTRQKNTKGEQKTLTKKKKPVMVEKLFKEGKGEKREGPGLLTFWSQKKKNEQEYVKGMEDIIRNKRRHAQDWSCERGVGTKRPGGGEHFKGRAHFCLGGLCHRGGRGPVA